MEAVALAFALAMDAFAIALVQGARFRPALGRGLAIALLFGSAQGAMAAAGWGLGTIALERIEAFDHWIAFALLAGVGLMMLKGGGEEEAKPLLGGIALLAAAIATSIDALAAGVALPTMHLDPVLAVVLIAGVTVVLSLAGVQIGRSAGERFGRPAEVLGGIVLIALGFRILADHMEWL
ncbi:MAG: manganese efflux pump MntP [Erythrobacter sp.]